MTKNHIKSVSSEQLAAKWLDDEEKSNALGEHMLPDEFLALYGESARAFADDHLGMQFDPSLPVCERWIDAISEMRRTLLPAQLHSVCALSEGYLRHGHRGLFLDGQPGVGKTTVGIALAWLLCKMSGARRVVVITPPHLIDKWAREIRQMLGADGEVLLLNDGLSVRRLQGLLDAPRRGDKLQFALMNSVRARLGDNWRPACSFRFSPISKKLLACCSSCGNFMTHGNERNLLGCISREDLLRTVPEIFVDGVVARPARRGTPQLISFSRRTNCPFCGAHLWQMVGGGKPPRERTVDALLAAGMKSRSDSIFV